MAKKTILVIEDDYIDRVVLSKILSVDYNVIEAENGLEALNILDEQHENIALILLDIMMPVMNGFDFLRQMHSYKEYAIIPVIVTTLSDSKSDELEALSNGATDFIYKPYMPQVILHRINNLIQLRESAAIINQIRFDKLTGLYSREFFYQKVRELLRENPDEEYTMFSINIENFKLLNDALGVEACDILLKQIAATIRLDVGDDGICGRYGADRFLYIKRRLKEIDVREKKIDSMHKYYHDNMNGLSIKWGIYEINDNQMPVDKMCDRAMLAVNSITGLYNTNFAVYDDSLRDRLVREKTITDIAEQSLERGEFVPFYQPQYSLDDECLIGAEALVRWKHPQWGCISPADFVPIFERNGFIGRLDKYIWEQACKHLRKWIDAGYTDMRVSVNISRVDVYQFNILDYLQSLMRKYELEPNCLHLEITESAYSENPTQLSRTISELRQHGFVVEMDDFGSGYSSLNMLSHIHLDALKLDLNFISNETSKPFDVSILNDIISMAHRLDLHVIAEGVETREQLRRLRAVGCDFVQGYFFAKPMPVENFDKLLKAQRIAKPKAINKLLAATGRRYLLVVDATREYMDKIAPSLSDRYGLLYAGTAADAINYIDSEDKHVALILMCMKTPAEDIKKIMFHVRQVPRNWRIPVIAALHDFTEANFTPQVRECDDYLCQAHPLFDLQRRIDNIMDPIEYNEREKILKDDVCRDYLTGLYNHHGLQLAIANITEDEYPVSICMFGLDNLKQVNEEQGYEVGDRFIEAFARIVEHATRNTDIKCRYGADEFIVIFKRLREESAVAAKVEEICAAYAKENIVEGLTPSCSAGIVLCGEETAPSARLIEQADKAMYKAKNENRGHYYVVHNEKL